METKIESNNKNGTNNGTSSTGLTEDNLTKQEIISQEQLAELGEDLLKNKADPVNALKIMKVLARKEITYQLLKDTLIGQKVTAVQVPEDD